MRKALWYAAVLLFPAAAHASFNAAPCRDFACHFGMIGILLGFMGGIPISGVIFIVLHLVFADPDRSKIKQLFLGGLMGIIAFELAAVSAALMATWGKSTVGHHEYYGLIGFAFVYVPVAIASVLYARSSPRITYTETEGGAG